MKQITLEELLEAGCHFGHQVTRSNPKARDFVFEARDNIQIIDLAKTKEGLDLAAEFVNNLGERGGSLLVVGTKRQARDIIEQEIARVKDLLEKDGKASSNKIFYITQRWIGGVLTNFTEISRNFKKLEDLKEKITNPDEKAKYTKKEIGLFDKERQRLESFYQGIAAMTKKPDALFIVDSHLEDLAVREALNMGVTTVGIVDTNADPYLIDHPIPANDDAVGSIKLIVTHILDAYAEGLKNQKVEIQAPNPKPKVASESSEKITEPEKVKTAKPVKTSAKQNPKTETEKASAKKNSNTVKSLKKKK